jgi:hypothetical protein
MAALHHRKPAFAMTAVVLTTVLKLTHPMKIVILLAGFLTGVKFGLSLREECTPRIPKQDTEENILIQREEVIDWRKLHTEGLHNLYSSQNVIRINLRREMDGL